MTTEGTLGNVTDVILVTGAGLDKPLAYVRLEPMDTTKLKSTEEPNEKIDATADTSWDDNWDDWGDWEDAPEDHDCACDLDCTCGNCYL